MNYGRLIGFAMTGLCVAAAIGYACAKDYRKAIYFALAAGIIEGREPVCQRDAIGRSGGFMNSSVTAAPRSSLAVTRNPLLALPAFQAIRKLSPESRAVLRQLLLDMSADANLRAEKCWRKSKGPMAAYWKAVAVYAKHTSRLLREQIQ